MPFATPPRLSISGPTFQTWFPAGDTVANLSSGNHWQNVIGNGTVAHGVFPVAISELPPGIPAAARSIVMRPTDASGIQCDVRYTTNIQANPSQRMTLYARYTPPTATPQHCAAFVVRCMFSSGFTHFAECAVKLKPGFNVVDVGPGNWRWVEGSGTTGAGLGFSDIRSLIFVTGGGAGAVGATFEVLGLEFGRQRRPVVSIGVDDGHTTTFTQLWPLQQKWGIPVTHYLIGRQVDVDANTITSANVATMLARPDLVQIGNHTFTHPDLSTLTYDQQIAELRQCDARLIQLGGVNNPARRIVAYPFGGFNDDTRRAMRELGMIYGRGVVDGNPEVHQAHVPCDPYRFIPTNPNQSISPWVHTADQMFVWVLQGAQRGVHQNFYFHQFVAAPAGALQHSITEVDRFFKLLAEGRAAGLFDLMFESEWAHLMLTGSRTA